MKVEFFKHSVAEEDISRVADILRTVFLTTGAEVAQFENDLGEYLGGQHVTGLTSCTAGLHLALLAWGVGAGDEVITTPMSFCATANAIQHTGAKPVFVDVEPDTGNINAGLIAKAITNRTKAIMPVHLYGQLCDMRAIRRIADDHGLVVIEDSAHCIEGRRDGIAPGQLGDAACYSFYATKNITSGEGGAVSTKDPQKAELLKTLRLHGMDKSAADRYTKKYSHWDMVLLGWKYNMDNIQAALLIGQLSRIEHTCARRRELADRYDEAFSGLPGIRLIQPAPGAQSARHLYTIMVDRGKRDQALAELQERSVGVAVNFRAIHLLRYYRETFGYKEGDFPEAEDIGERTISIPLYPKLGAEEQDYVIKSVTEVTGGL